MDKEIQDLAQLSQETYSLQKILIPDFKKKTMVSDNNSNSLVH